MPSSRKGAAWKRFSRNCKGRDTPGKARLSVEGTSTATAKAKQGRDLIGIAKAWKGYAWKGIGKESTRIAKACRRTVGHSEGNASRGEVVKCLA